MAPLCELCNVAESKYKCPACGLRYCSIACYKPHKSEHDDLKRQNGEEENATKSTTRRQIDRPGTTQRAPKQSFADFEEDAELQRLLKRYPSLQTQLQGVYALTLDPGPQEDRYWNRGDLPLLKRKFNHTTRGRGNHNRGQGVRGDQFEPPEGRQGGRWTKEKGDQEAMFVLRRSQEDDQLQDLADGMSEFVELVQMRFGSGRGEGGQAR